MPEGQSNSEQYKDIESKVNASKIALKITKDIKKTEESVKNSVDNYNKKGDGLEDNLRKKVDGFTDKISEKKKQYKNQGKNQLDSLVELFKTTFSTSGGTSSSTSGGSTSGETSSFGSRVGTAVSSTISEIFINTTNKSIPRIKQLFLEETISAIGCSQEQEYIPRDIYINVSSIDIYGDTLKNSPNEKPGKFLYEPDDFSPNVKPYSFNRELYNRIQNKGVSYLDQYGVEYLGITNQPLFNITYVTNNGVSNGDFFKVKLSQRQQGNKVIDFLGDYLETIDVINLNQVYTNVLNLITGSLSFSLKYGDDKLRDQKKWEKIVQRILGMCFDNKTEIDVSGVGKVDQLDQIDDSLFTLDELDDIEIENSIKNILSGVVEYVDCGSVQLPITSPLIINLLDDLNDTNLTPTDYNFLGNNLLNTLSQNPEWKLILPNLPDFSDIINNQFLKLIPVAIVNSLLSPKHLFPLFVLTKSLNNSLSDGIENLEDFSKLYKKYIINLTSKILAIFVEELVKEIKKSITKLIQELLNQELNELIRSRGKKVQSVLLLINASLTVLAGISDYRRCQSIIDELQQLLQTGARLAKLQGGQAPPIINYFAFLKPGMTSTSILKRVIERLEESGVPTGDLPSGAPNKSLIILKGELDSIIDEIAENGKVSVAISSTEVNGLLYGATPILNLSGNFE